MELRDGEGIVGAKAVHIRIGISSGDNLYGNLWIGSERRSMLTLKGRELVFLKIPGRFESFVAIFSHRQILQKGRNF